MKYRVVYHYPDGEEGYEEDLFDTEEEAREAGDYGCSCYALGAEILNMSNPGDYPLDGSEGMCEFDVVEVDE